MQGLAGRIGRGASRGLLAGLAAGLGPVLGSLLWAGGAWALEPVPVTVEVVLDVRPDETPSQLRQRARQEMYLAAVLEVASKYIAPDRLETESEALRDALRPIARNFVLNFRPETPTRRIDPEDPAAEREQYVQELSATVDAEQLREKLEELGWVTVGGALPSVVVRTELLPGDALGAAGTGVGRDPDLTATERLFRDALAAKGYTVIEPALYPGAADSASALDLGRAVGADLSIAVRVRWRGGRSAPTGARGGGVAEVGFVAYRARDAAQLAIGRFEGIGYDPSPQRAFETASGAAAGQAVQSLQFQLEQNFGALQSAVGPLTLRLEGLSSFGQVERVQRTLLDVLGAKEARISLIEPRSAELVVQAELSPGALQERLAAATFEGFRLDPVQVEAERLSLRLEPVAVVPDAEEVVVEP